MLIAAAAVAILASGYVLERSPLVTFAGLSTAVAQSAKVSCFALGCYGANPYSQQCAQAKRGWEENRRTCEGVFHDNSASMENCIHSLDWTVNSVCTCAEACSKATCTRWRADDNTCVSAAWR
jgi:hypothetical protein